MKVSLKQLKTEWENAISYLSTRKSNNCNRSLRWLGYVKEVIEQCLILVMNKQVKFIQYKQDWTTACSISWDSNFKS